MKGKSQFLGLLVFSMIISSIITYVLIVSGIDWAWAKYFNDHEIFVWMSVPAVVGGMGIPFLIILNFLVNWKRKHSSSDEIQLKRSSFSFAITYLLMTVLKVFTNRVDMEPFEPIGDIDISNQFRFGFMNSNSWWESLSEGWPSGHTMIAVGMAIAIHPLLKNTFWRKANIVYPILVALSVSTAFHWISDVISGGLIGVIVGLYAAKGFNHSESEIKDGTLES